MMLSQQRDLEGRGAGGIRIKGGGGRGRQGRESWATGIFPWTISPGTKKAHNTDEKKAGISEELDSNWV